MCLMASSRPDALVEVGEAANAADEPAGRPEEPDRGGREQREDEEGQDRIGHVFEYTKKSSWLSPKRKDGALA